MDETALRALVRQAIMMMSADPPELDSSVAALGERAGLSKAEINYLIALPMSAFALRYYKETGVDFLDLFSIHIGDKTYTQRRLSNQAIYVAATDIGSSWPKEHCWPLTARSAEHASLEKAIQAGADLKGATLAVVVDPYFILPADAYP